MEWVEVTTNFEPTGEHTPLGKKFFVPNEIYLALETKENTIKVNDKVITSKKYIGVESAAAALAEYLGVKPTRIKRVLLSDIIEAVDKNGEIAYYLHNEMGAYKRVERW